MGIREHYVSSVFFHFIGILFWAAIAQFHPKVYPVLTVSLHEDSARPMAKAAQAKTEEPMEPEEPGMAASAGEKHAEPTVPLPEESVSAEQTSLSLAEPAGVPETPETAAPGLADQGREMSKLAQIHHAFATHTYTFVENASRSIQAALHREIASGPAGELSEGTAEVLLYFNDEGGLREIWGATTSEKLHVLLDRLDWKSIPLPGTYRLRMKSLHVKIKIDRGEPSLVLTGL